MPISEVAKKKITRDENAFYGNLYGRGISNPLVSMFSTAHRVTFLHRGTMNKKFKQHAKFLMPSVCDTQMDMSTHPFIHETVRIILLQIIRQNQMVARNGIPASTSSRNFQVFMVVIGKYGLNFILAMMWRTTRRLTTLLP